MIDPAIHRNPHPATTVQSAQAQPSQDSRVGYSADSAQTSLSRSETILSTSQTTVSFDGGHRSSSSSVTAMYHYSETRYTPSSSLSNPELGQASRYQPDLAHRQDATYTPQGVFATISTRVSTSDSEQAVKAGVDNTSVGGNTAVSGMAAVAPESDRTDAANTILAFIQQQLAADLVEGADNVSLQSRLQAGLDGFMQGYREAANELGGLTGLPPEVVAQIEKTFNDVLQGVSDIAAKLGLQDPTVDLERKAAVVEPSLAPASGDIGAATSELSLAETFASLLDKLRLNPEIEALKTLLQASETFYSKDVSTNSSDSSSDRLSTSAPQLGAILDQESSSSRLFNLQLVTADGDKVNIRSYGDYGQRSQTSEGASQYNESSLSRFKLTVEGDLDTEELKAINALLGRVTDVAETFFSGDITAAFDQALELGIESDEIARFAVNLQQTSYSHIEGRIEDSYGKVAAVSAQRLSIREGEYSLGQGPRFGGNPMQMLAGFIQQLEQIRSDAANSGFGLTNVGTLSDAIGIDQFSGNARSHQFGPFMANMMAALQRQHD